MPANEYYVWMDNEEHGPYTLEELLNARGDGTIPAGFLWRRGDETQYRNASELDAEATRRTKGGARPPPTMRGFQSDPSWEYLRSVRARSKYGTLRGLLAISFWVVTVFLVIVTLLGMSVDSPVRSRSSGTLVMPMMVVTACVGIAVSRGIYELGLLFIDGVDALLEIGSRRNLPPEGTQE